MNGYGERCGNANLVTIIPNLQLKLGYECVTDEQLASLTQTAHFFDEMLNFTPDPDQPYVGRNAFAHKGGMHVAGVNVDPATFEHVDPDGRRQPARAPDLRAVGQGHRATRAPATPGSRSATARRGRLIERVKELEHRGYHFEAADGSFELLLRKETGEYEPLFTLESWRAIVEKRADGTRRDRGDDQDLDRRDGRALRAHRRGQRPRERARPGAPGRAGGDPSTPARHRPRQLQGADPRRDQGHGGGHARAARRLRRRRRCGARSACRRTSSRPPGRRSSTRSSTACRISSPPHPSVVRPGRLALGFVTELRGRAWPATSAGPYRWRAR